MLQRTTHEQINSKKKNYKKQHYAELKAKSRKNYCIKAEKKLNNKLKKGSPRIVYQFVNSDDKDSDNSNNSDLEFKIINTTPQLSIEAEKKEQIASHCKFIETQPHVEKNKVRSKKEISGDAQITCAVQNQLNLLLGLPLIPHFLAYQAPKFTPEEIAEYKKNNKFFWSII